MPTQTDSILDIRQEAPPHDHLLVADETMAPATAVSDAVHMAKHTGREVALFYRGEIVLADPAPNLNSVLTKLKEKLATPPDYDPEAAAFPHDETAQ